MQRRIPEAYLHNKSWINERKIGSHLSNSGEKFKGHSLRIVVNWINDDNSFKENDYLPQYLIFKFLCFCNLSMRVNLKYFKIWLFFNWHIFKVCIKKTSNCKVKRIWKLKIEASIQFFMSRNRHSLIIVVLLNY